MVIPTLLPLSCAFQLFFFSIIFFNDYLVSDAAELKVTFLQPLAVASYCIYLEVGVRTGGDG